MRDYGEAKSVAEYLKVLQNFGRSDLTKGELVTSTFFRGQANEEWNLSPGLYREGLFEEEKTLLDLMRIRRPEDFKCDRFETLVNMQHYGLPTRLLDFTTNPLVALYFACASKTDKEKNGAVFVVMEVSSMWSYEPLVRILMDFVFEFGYKHIQLGELLEKIQIRYGAETFRSKIRDEVTLLRFLENPLPVMPDRTNRRIAAQDGVFFICYAKSDYTYGSTDVGELGRLSLDFKPVDLDFDKERSWPNNFRIIIPAKAKSSIIQQLDLLGINEGTLFPDLSHQIQHVTKYVKMHKPGNKDNTHGN